MHAYDAARRWRARARSALEWDEEAPELDTVLVAVGGGGLIAGIAAWYGRRVKVVGVEPEGPRALRASLAPAVRSMWRSTASRRIRSAPQDRARSSTSRADVITSRWCRTRPSRGAAAAVGAPAGRRRTGRSDGARGAGLRPLPAARERTRRRAVVRRECGREQARELEFQARSRRSHAQRGTAIGRKRFPSEGQPHSCAT